MTTMDKFIDDYLKRGFGSMTKRDFEVFIMHQLLQGKLKGKSNYEISRELRISEAKVKNLIYETKLKYPSTDDRLLLENFIDCLLKTKSKLENGQIKFIIEDVATRKYLDNLLKQNNLYSDTSFNSELVVIKPQSLCNLLKIVVSSKEGSALKDKILNTSDDIKKERIWKAVSNVVNSVTKGMVDNIVDDFLTIFQPNK